MALTKIAAKPDTKKVNTNTFYLNYNKMNAVKTDIVKQLNTISSSFKQIGTLTDKAIKDGTISGSVATAMKNYSQKVKNQANYTANHAKNIKNRISSDLTKQKEQTLNKRIAQLEAIVKKLQAKIGSK